MFANLPDRAQCAKKSTVTPQARTEQSNPLPSVPGACAATPGTSEGEHWRWCPRCGHELHNEKCKLRCPRCHYFMSCSDFD